MAHTVNVLKTQSFHFDFNGQNQNPIPTETDRFGQVVYFPITFSNDDAPARADFQTTVNFRLNQVNQNHLVFFMAPAGTIFPPPGRGSKHVISVEFVTPANPSASRKVPTEIAIYIPYPNRVVRTEVPLNQDVTALIQYKHVQKKITVSVTGSPNVLTYDYDLSTLLDQEVEVGLAVPGDTVDNPQVSKWDFKATLYPLPAEE